MKAHSETTLNYSITTIPPSLLSCFSIELLDIVPTGESVRGGSWESEFTGIYMYMFHAHYVFYMYLYSPGCDWGFSPFSLVLIQHVHPYCSFQVIDEVQCTTCVILRTQLSYMDQHPHDSAFQISHH